MQSTSTSHSRQQFIPLLSTPRSRQPSASSTSASSIWAPQPVSPTRTWPAAITSLSQTAAEHDGRQLQRANPFPVVDDRPVTKEDVFGIVGPAEGSHQKGVGAIGDGRSRETVSSENDVGGHLVISVLPLPFECQLYAHIWPSNCTRIRL